MWILFFFLAQLWKYNDEKLENKNGDWMYMEETWILSKKNKTEKGQVIEVRDSIGRGLKRDSDNRGMNLKVKHKVGPHLFPKLFTLGSFSSKILLPGKRSPWI